jgi:hypothetical protein
MQCFNVDAPLLKLPVKASIHHRKVLVPLLVLHGQDHAASGLQLGQQGWGHALCSRSNVHRVVGAKLRDALVPVADCGGKVPQYRG